MADDRKSVLVVEDDEQSQKYMSILLAKEFDVSIAATSEQVWEILMTKRVDLILMDLSLRNGDDGLQITRRIRVAAKNPRVPIIALTAHAFPEDRKRSLEAGCDDYVSKPFQWSHLHAMMLEYMAD
jgi:CheY-like chemotaxis protein